MANTHLDGLFVLKALLAPHLPIVDLPLEDPEISEIGSAWQAAIIETQQTPEGRVRITKVLVNGASGGVGTFAVQMAKAFGGEVTGVCSTRNVELVRSIGADHVVDYTQIDFTRTGQKYDLIFDAVGNCSVGDYRRALTPQGRGAVAGFTTVARAAQVALLGPRGQQKIGMFLARPNQDDLLAIKELLEAGKIVPVIDRTYPLSQTADAIRYLETSRARGKVVVVVDEIKTID